MRECNANVSVNQIKKKIKMNSIYTCTSFEY